MNCKITFADLRIAWPCLAPKPQLQVIARFCWNLKERTVAQDFALDSLSKRASGSMLGLSPCLLLVGPAGARVAMRTLLYPVIPLHTTLNVFQLNLLQALMMPGSGSLFAISLQLHCSTISRGRRGIAFRGLVGFYCGLVPCSLSFCLHPRLGQVLGEMQQHAAGLSISSATHKSYRQVWRYRGAQCTSARFREGFIHEKMIKERWTMSFSWQTCKISRERRSARSRKPMRAICFQMTGIQLVSICRTV